MSFTKLESKFNITKSIRKILLSNSGITSYVNNNIFPLQAPEGTKGNIIVYGRNKYSKEYTKFGPIVSQCQINIIVISDNYDSSLTIADLVDNVLEGEHVNEFNTYKYQCRLIDSDEDLIDDKYIQSLIFEID